MADDHDVQAWRALLLAQNAVLRAIDEDMAAADAVTLNVYDVLLELNAAPRRRLRIKDLAARTVLTRSRISKLIDELAAGGLVDRVEDSTDRRGSVVVITAAGRRALKKGAPVYLAGIARHFTSHLHATEGAVIIAALSRIVEAHRPLIELRSSR